MERLDKILASQGVGSRKEVQKLIKSGAVTINGKICKKSDEKINPDSDVITVGGQVVEYSRFVYIMMNKPSGVVSASTDKNDKTVIDILPEEYKRAGLFPAGRLDKDTEGLLIITDDGDFAHRMLSPRKHVYKTYYAELDSEIDDSTIKAFKDGIVFADGTECMSAELKYADENDKKHVYVKICEGKFHQVKKMFACCGKKVVYLKRISIGGLHLDSNLPIGSCRKLTNLDKELIFMGILY